MINDKSSILKIILAVVILGSAGLATYFIMPKKTPPITVTPTPSIDVSDWKTYKNLDIGIEFKYPLVLGAPEILQTDNTDKNPQTVFKGKKIDVRFKDTNNDSWLLFVAYTPDYQSFKDLFIFRGNINISSECFDPFIFNNKGEGCKTVEIANNKAIWKNYFNEDECSPVFGSQVYFNNKSQSIYKGLSFMFHFKDAEKKVTDLYSCVDDKATEQAYSEAVVQSKNIMEKKNLSKDDLQKINLIDQIFSTFKFTK